MSYNPAIHHRKSVRLKGYDYSQAGLYFITICTHDRKCLFGEIVGGRIILNDFGEVAYQQWEKLPGRFSNMEFDVFQIMPNHMHGIINVGAGFTPAPYNAIDNNNNLNPGGVGAGFTLAQNNAIGNDVNLIFGDIEAGFAPTKNYLDGNENEKTRAGASPAPTIGDIIGAYKSLVARDCLEISKQKNPNEILGKLWQRNYHEHIIRNEKSYQRISEYIMNNPARWSEDKFYTAVK